MSMTSLLAPYKVPIQFQAKGKLELTLVCLILVCIKKGHTMQQTTILGLLSLGLVLQT